MVKKIFDERFILDGKNEKHNGSSLKRTLGPLMLWGLGVGYVISGMYFGWNLGLEKGGVLGLAIATIFVIIMYVCFTFSYTEMACAIPKAGGVFSYANRAYGRKFGFLGGMAQNIEFIFAPPAIAIAIGSYLQLLLTSFGIEAPVLLLSIIAYLVFTAINIRGVRIAATFELLITVIAVIELLIFFFAASPSLEITNLIIDPLPNGIPGIFAAVPFAIWFFLAIEGVANVAEETVNPQKNVLIGFGSALLTLVVLCICTFVFSVGVNGWETVVYDNLGNHSDSPLPLALAHAYGKEHIYYRLVTSIGLFGLIASFHGILLAGGRSTYEFSKSGFAPKLAGKIDKKYNTPKNALIINTILGIVALFSGKTGEIITIAVMGALTLYIISMISFLKLRKSEPELDRPFKTPWYPLTPIIALVLSTICLIAVASTNIILFIIFLFVMIGSFIVYSIIIKDEI